MRKTIFTILLLQGLGASAQTSVSSATFGTLEARHLGPGTMSGRISAIDGVAADEGKTIYVGAAGGGVWKTTNAGASFKSVFDKYTQSIGAIAIDQKNKNTVYVGTGESNMRNSVSIGDGLYKTTDGGDNWSRVGLDSTEHIAKIAIDPSNSNILYVAAPGPLWSDSKHRGLYKSTDAGKTWDKILYISEKAGVADVSIDPANPNIVYATSWEFRRLPYLFNSGGTGSGIWKSLDAGKTWKELSNGLPAKPFGRVALALAPSAPQNLLAIVESKNTGLYISADGGETWKQQSAPMNVTARPFYFAAIAIDPTDPKRVYRPGFTFSYSTDGGYSFADASSDGGWMHSDMHAIWINPANRNHLLVGTDGGVYMSLDRGATWMFMQNLPVGQFYHVDHDLKDPYNVYGGLQDNGSWVAPSSKPGGVMVGDWKAIYGGDGFWVTPDPTDPEYAYAESQGGDVNRINLRTMKNVSIRPQTADAKEKLRWNWNSPIVAGQANKKNLYVACQYVYRSNDHGHTWARISPDLTTNDKKKQEQENSGGLSADNTSAENHTTVFTIAESPLDENLVWAGTDDGNLQVTLDGGKTWNNVAANVAAAGLPAQTWVSSIEPSRFDRNTVYATFDNHMYGDHKTWAGKSSDGGKTWTIFKSSEFTGFAHKIKEDLKNKDLLFLGTEMGLFGTVDGGVNWFRMKNNIPWYALVRDIRIHPVTHDLIIATHGRGIMIVDDISPMRSLTKDVIEKDVHLFPNDKMVLTMGKFGDGGFPSTGGWGAGNAASIPPITYYLKDRVSTGDAKVEILDADGKLVQSIPGGKRKGINKVSWNQRMIPPKTAGGSTKPDQGAFIAPQVLPGDYTVKLTVAGKSYTQPLKLVHEDADGYTLDDRKKNHDAAMELYRMHEQLSRVTNDIQVRQKLIKDNLDKVKSKKAKKEMQEYYDKLEALRAELVPTKQTSAFADEERLREDITQVFAGISFSEAAPNNLQVERIKTLQQRVNTAEKTSTDLGKQYDERIQATLVKEGLDKSKLETPKKAG